MMKNFSQYIRENVIASVSDEIKINIEIDKTKHAAKRQYRHGLDKYISDDEIINIVKMGIDELTQALIDDKIDINDHVILKYGKMNIVGKIKKSQDKYKLIIITVIRKKDFKSKDYIVHVYENNNQNNTFEDFFNQIKNSEYKPISDDIWDIINDCEGFTEEVNNFEGDFNREHYSMTELEIPIEDKIGLQKFDNETIDKYNDFDIELKEKGYYPNYIDLIDYDKGKIVIVKWEK